MFPVAPTRVLLVEDDAPTRELYRSALRHNGYSVTAVGDGLTALHSIESHVPDVVVLDMALPQLGGLDVLHELRANPATRAIPIIVVTGTDIVDPGERALAPVLTKPVHPETLMAAIEDARRRVVHAAWRP